MPVWQRRQAGGSATADTRNSGNNRRQCFPPIAHHMSFPRQPLTHQQHAHNRLCACCGERARIADGIIERAGTAHNALEY